MIRRALRIFPAYYLMLLLTWLCDFSSSRQLIIWNATYTSNIYLCWTRHYNPLSHFWSLAVEEQFYLIWPWVVLWCRRSGAAGDLPDDGGTLSPLSSSVQAWQPALEPTVLMPSAADALGIGALLAIWQQDPVLSDRLRLVQFGIGLPVFWGLQSYGPGWGPVLRVPGSRCAG